jgi:hypothetical protein
MPKTSIEQLVDKYSADREHYLSTVYNETQLRADFLDPLFELLGWDIKNTKGKPTNEREVLLEEPLKEEVLTNTKKPDYTFRLFSERKFYLEAKKPNVKIEVDVEPAKQTRRYGFTAKLKISVLSNFEYLAIYDCSEKVEEADTVTKARIKIYHYTEYVEAFETIRSELGCESVYSGAFDRTWEHIEEQLKRFSVDSLFLNQINEWRLILGKDVFNHRPDLSEAQLNDIVQRYLNSIIFLRVSEDRNLEEYKTLLSIATADNFDALVDKFSQADRKYNSGLFNHELTEEIIRDNTSAFWTIIQQLYYPESTYSFAVFASDILGNIYEIYLSQQLVIKENGVSLEKKPDHVDRDVVTTPTYVIQDILRQTVGKYCEDKTDTEIFDAKFADIACGSGAFLLETYQLLNDILIDYYLEHSPEILIQTTVSTYKLAFNIKRRILENCLFGVDKDFNAVEACKFGLLLKLLEDEDNSTIPVPALPDITNVIHFGNSLIESSETTDENRAGINPYDFGDTRFDVIVGNPPYMATENIKEFTPLELPIYKQKFATAYKQFDKYFLFIERSYNLLVQGGYLGYIIPSKFTKVGAAKELRKLLKESESIDALISFGANQVFQDKTTYTCLLILHKKERGSFDYLEVKNLQDWKTRNIHEDAFEPVGFSELEDDGWVLVTGELKDVYEKINTQSITLADLIGSENIYNGIQTSANDIYIHTPTKEDERYLYFHKDGTDWMVEKELTRPYFKTSGGIDNLNTYRPLKPNSFVIYPYVKTTEGEIRFVELDQLRTEFPMAFAYLSAYQTTLQAKTRDIKPEPTTENEWYRYGRHQSLDKCDVPAKIVVGVLSQGDKYAIDYSSTLISSGGTAGYCMITLPAEIQYSIYYIQALLNSKYLEWYSALIGEVFRGGYIARGTKVLKRLPIRTIDFSSRSDKALHDKIAQIQEQLIKIQEEIDRNNGNERAIVPLHREFNSLKTELDQTLKSLHGLSDQEDNKIPLISEIYATT